MKISDINLGELDAADDENLLSYVVKLPLLDSIQDGSKWIVYGPKGSGKTAVRRILEDETQLFVSISVDQAIDLPVEGYSSPADLRNKISALLVALVLSKLQQKEIIEKTWYETFSESSGVGFMKKLFGGVTVGIGVVKWTAKELFSSDGDKTVDELLSKETLAKVRSALSGKKLYILVDDLDLLLSTSNPQARKDSLSEFIEAAADIRTKLLKGVASVIVFLKTEIYREIKKVSTEFDKHSGGVTRILWTAPLLDEVIRKRLAWTKPDNSGDIDSVVSEGNSLEDVIERVNELSISGPRQALVLLGLAVHEAQARGSDTVGLDDIAAVEADFGAEILDNFSAFYQSVYPDIQDVIDRSLRDGPSSGPVASFEQRIKDEVLSDTEFKAAFPNKWPFRRTANALLKIFYEVGAIGISRNQRMHFSLIDGSVSFRPADELVVHPGLRSHLNTN